LHPARIEVNGAKVRVRLCTKCLRELRGRSTRAKKAAAKAAAAISSSAPAASGLA
jgi:ribosomal protein L28